MNTDVAVDRSAPVRDRWPFRFLVTAVLFDRIAYHGVLALLIFYFTDAKGMSTADSAVVFGAFGALVYAATPFGAAVADQLLGLRAATLGGAWLLLLGVVLIAIDATALAPWPGSPALYSGMACMVVGLGALSPAVANLVGALTGGTDTERESAYSQFWVVMNVGVLIGPLLCGWLGQAIGWSVGFGACVVAMAVSVVLFQLSARSAPLVGLPPTLASHSASLRGVLRRRLILIPASACGVVLAWWLLRQTALVGNVLTVVFVGAIGTYLYFAFWRCNAMERARALTCLAIAIFSFVFLVLLNQYGTTLAFFAAKHVQLIFLGLQFEPSQVVSFQPAFLVLLSPAILAGAAALARRGREVTALHKMALGLTCLAVAFGWLAFGARYGEAIGGLHMSWMISFYALMAISELLVAPIGLSFTAKLAVPRIAGFTVAIWMLSWSAASYVAALGGGWVSSGPSLATIDQSLLRYALYFALLAGGGLAAAGLLYALSPALQRRVHAALARSEPAV
ncbi:MAG: oligopeptide:H+ symporter [Phycisphaerae bacterium]|nr:oligopeptide:H+ symporter [Phycisphaerae bacterium]